MDIITTSPTQEITRKNKLLLKQDVDKNWW